MGFPVTKEVLFLEMSRSINTKFYRINLLESSVEIKMNKRNKKDWIITIVLLFSMLLPFLGLLLLGIMGKLYFFIVMSTAFILILMIASLDGFRLEQKRVKKYNFSINQNGVTHIDLDNTYHMQWEEIRCYGISTNNFMGGIRRTSYNTQSVIFFSKKTISDNQLKKFFDRIENKRYQHASTEHMVVWNMKQEDNQEVYLELKKYIERFCENAIEIDVRG